MEPRIYDIYHKSNENTDKIKPAVM